MMIADNFVKTSKSFAPCSEITDQPSSKVPRLGLIVSEKRPAAIAGAHRVLPSQSHDFSASRSKPQCKPPEELTNIYPLREVSSLRKVV
jgi:hypothetical protein